MSYGGANIGGLQTLTKGTTQCAFDSMDQDDAVGSVDAKKLMNHKQTARSILMEPASAKRVPMILAACLVFLSGPGAFALNNGQALTPPMGWNSWNTFGWNHPEYSDQLIRQTADAMVSSGMKDVGYRYVNLDDGWTQPTGDGDGIKRDARGGIIPSTKFPNMRALTSYVHSKGLSIGIYLSCESTGGHEQQDADSIVAWGFDYLKYDFCDRPAFVKMRDCLKTAVSKARAAGNTAVHEIVYSMSMEWQGSCLYGDTVANLTTSTSPASAGAASCGTSMPTTSAHSAHGQVRGTIPICWWSAKHCRSTRTARTFRSGAWWQPLSSQATICATCPRRPRPF